MDIFQIVSLGLIATILAVLVKGESPQIGIYISLATGIIIFVFIAAQLQSVLEVLDRLAGQINFDDVYFHIILRIVGIAYIAEFGAQVCKDAGEGVIAAKVQFAGKVLIMVLAVPILVSLMDLIVSIML